MVSAKTLVTSDQIRSIFSKPKRNLSLTTGRDQSGCTAEHLLKNVIDEVGIDIIEGKVNNTWTCKNLKGPGSIDARDRRCPLDQYMNNDSYQCFSNVSSGFPYICVAGAKSENIEETYSDSETGKIRIPRARFSQLFSFQNENNITNIQMDVKGCEASRVRINDNTGFFNTGDNESNKEDVS